MIHGTCRKPPARTAMVPPEVPDFLTVDEAAALLRVNRKTLYESIRLGQIPGTVRLGRVLRIRRSALVNWMPGNSGPALGAKP